MATPSERNRWREELLLALYEVTDGDTRRAQVNYRELWPKTSITDAAEATKGIDYLVDRGLAEWKSMGGILGITQDGVDAAEQMIDPTLNPVAVLSVAEVQQLERLLTALRKVEDAGELDAIDPEDRAEIHSDVAVLREQLRSPRPKRDIVRAALKWVAVRLGEVALGAAGNGAYEIAKELSKRI